LGGAFLDRALAVRKPASRRNRADAASDEAARQLAARQPHRARNVALRHPSRVVAATIARARRLMRPLDITGLSNLTGSTRSGSGVVR